MAAGARAVPRPRPRFVRDGEVSVVRVPPAAHLAGETGRELAEERAARHRAEEVLADAQGTISRPQAARARADQALQAAHATVEEREAAMAGLRAELASAAQREAALIEAARVEAERVQAEARLRPVLTAPSEQEPARCGWTTGRRRGRSSVPQGPAPASASLLPPVLALPAAWADLLSAVRPRRSFREAVPVL